MEIKNKVFNESCITFLQRLRLQRLRNNTKNKIIDHVITDIPYDVVSREDGIRKYNKGQADILDFNLEDFCSLLKENVKGNILIFCSTEQLSVLNKQFANDGYNTYIGIWRKTNPSPALGQFVWLSGIECCFVASKNKIQDKDLLWVSTSGRSKEHPTEKPLKLLEQIVSIFTEENEMVYDPCAGSGNHLIACKNLNRNYVGTEIFPEYYQLINSKL